nr:2-oxoglutarate (2OG) and Fe(II)-dependent oxygenase superfamily protein [Tanacetum cinerariifolium]
MSSFDEIDGEDLEDVGIKVNRNDGDISEEDECTNTERHEDYDALNLFRLLLKSIDDHVLADTLWEYGLSKLLLFTGLTIRGRVAVGLNPNIRLYRYK